MFPDQISSIYSSIVMRELEINEWNTNHPPAWSEFD
jgi:hypothetical protein